ncbi:MAG: peroxiredoxin [Bdellovibrionota bacterium]
MSSLLKVGKPAPEFKSRAYVRGEFEEVTLAQHRGEWLCFFFYPLDFTFVCPTELRAFAEEEAKFRELGCGLVAASTDSEYSHKAWFERDLPEVRYPVLADTTRRVSADYGVLQEERGIALRGTFLIDPHGVLQWMSVNALQTGRSVEEILRTLQALQTGEMCPVGWKPGQKTL